MDSGIRAPLAARGGDRQRSKEGRDGGFEGSRQPKASEPIARRSAAHAGAKKIKDTPRSGNAASLYRAQCFRAERGPMKTVTREVVVSRGGRELGRIDLGSEPCRVCGRTAELEAEWFPFTVVGVRNAAGELLRFAWEHVEHAEGSGSAS